MMSLLQTIYIPRYTANSGQQFVRLPVSYHIFGEPLHTAPLVIVNHALTGNSLVCGNGGWWRPIVGAGKAIDTNQCTVLSFNIPGNGYDGNFVNNSYDFVPQDIAQLFLRALSLLNIYKIDVLVGGSLGGCIGWHMVATAPKMIKHFVPIASHWKTTDWVRALCKVQSQILENSSQPIEDARMHAMTFYRSPASFSQKFRESRTAKGDDYVVNEWLYYHGKKLKKRFSLSSYKMMNYLLMQVNSTYQTGNFEATFKNTTATIYLVGIPGDGLFSHSEIIKTYKKLIKIDVKVQLFEINSIHGHDAFLIENEQLSHILSPILDKVYQQKSQYEYTP